MPVSPSVQRLMTFSGDFGMDKWIAYKPGSLNTSSNATATIPHELGNTPLIYTQWSETSDFSIPREVMQNPSDLYPMSEPWVLNTWADATNLYLRFNNFGSNKTIYYRMWALPTHNWSLQVPTTATISGLSPYVFNGEQRYIKPYMSNRITVSSTPQSIDHDLGYYPTVMVWKEDQPVFGAGTIAPVFQPVIYVDSVFASIGIPISPSVSTTSLIFLSTGIYHYRIYLEPIYE